MAPDPEHLLLFRSFACFRGDQCDIHLRGWTFDPVTPSTWRRGLVSVFGRALGLTTVERRCPQFRRRASLFMVDNRAGQRVQARIAGHTFDLPPALPNGHFRATLTLPLTAVQPAPGAVPKSATSSASTPTPSPNWLPITLIDGDGQQAIGQQSNGQQLGTSLAFPTSIALIPPTGLSLISDIDDTIKDSRVCDKRELLRRTFFTPGQPVKAMARYYQSLAQRGIAFHYVTAAPWQLFSSTVEFLDAHDFPKGSIHMRSVRLKDHTIADLVRSPRAYKTDVIAELLSLFPQRRFILIGDTCEDDAPVFAALAARHPPTNPPTNPHPHQIAAIALRDAGGHDPRTLLNTFAQHSPIPWHIFHDGDDAPDFTDLPCVSAPHRFLSTTTS